MTQANSLALTALPNGFEGNSTLRLSVVLTPSISTDDATPVAVKGTPFDGWTSKVNQHPLSWSVKFIPTGGAPIVLAGVLSDAKPDWWPDLWTAIFGDDRQARNRKGNAELHNSWRLTHNISDLHDRHRRLRLAHALRALNTSMAKSAQGDSLSQFRQLHTSYNEDVDCYTPPILYLFPTLKNGDANDPNDASAQVDQRRAAVAARGQIDSAAGITADQKLKIQTRIDHALDLLETQEGARLQAVALYCLYRHCLTSVLPAGTDIESSPFNDLYKVFTNAAAPVVPAACLGSLDPVGAYQNYVEMLLFHRREPDPKQCTIGTPDFHQLLGMLNHYPAILRPLGLVFDLAVAIPAGLSDGTYLVEVSNPFNNAIFAGMGVVSYQTQCEVRRGDKVFISAPRDPAVLAEGYLSLDAKAADGGSAYSFSQEDADGSSLKFTDQANSAARASEYTSAAPTSMTTVPAANRFGLHPIGPTPSLSAHPTDAPPAARTVGLALFHQDRLATLEGVIQKAPAPIVTSGTPATPNDPGPFHAEDLMLGIRVDVKRGSWPWRSLCSRQSTYEVHPIDSSIGRVLKWSPQSEIELLADEGFVTFGATQSSLDDDSIQTQLHQSLFTWTGWSLAVPKPRGFESVNGSVPSECTETGPLGISAKYDLPPAAPLPALRFNDGYQLRCRVVDLAGNSVPCLDANTPHSITLDPVFSRHEPIRAPQILLTEPIDRDNSPGEQVNHLVARDGDEPASRMLVPPRESLRLAELHGLVDKKNRLPESAFTRQNLMPDGSFPCIAEAYKRGWITGPIDKDSTNNQDAIFTNRNGAFEAVNPFYPDPLAHYIRVKPFLVSDDPTRSRALGEGFYIEVDPLDHWPNFLAAIVDLNARPDGKVPTVDYDNDARPPSITVNLPPGYSVVLEVSSAADNGENKSRRTNKSKSVALHQFQASRLGLIENSSGRERLVHDFFGGDFAKAKNRHKALNEIAVDSPGHGTAASVLSDPNSYVNGDLPQMTPPRTITFVHAVRQPMQRPDFAPIHSAGDLVVRRAPGQSNAEVVAGIIAHWMSTGKVTCHAKWEDNVDDLKKDQPCHRVTNDVAFAITPSDAAVQAAPDFAGTSYMRAFKTRVVQVFPDSRAHTVTYSLSAATVFRGYYPPPKVPKTSNNPPAADESRYILPGVTERKLTVLSSVRPPVPSIAYVVPAFCWRDTYDAKTRTWYSGREVLLRAYFERPFLISGDLEGIGVVLAGPWLSSDESKQPLVSRWGSDPTKPITQPIASSALTEENFCQTDSPVLTCLLAEGGFANIKRCSVQFAKDRRLWFADIPINTLGSFCPFIRLALVRWQPEALHGEINPSTPPPAPVDPNFDARISGVVFADFMQISPNRWVSVQRRSDSVYVVTVSGVFPTPEGTSGEGSLSAPAITLSLFSRWYATGKDSGWRPVECKTRFNYTPAASYPADPSANISSWSAEVRLPHSAAHRKYRVLLQENEWFANSKTPRVTYSQFVDLP
jgi:hypothetical protein